MALLKYELIIQGKAKIRTIWFQEEYCKNKLLRTYVINVINVALNLFGDHFWQII